MKVGTMLPAAGSIQLNEQLLQVMNGIGVASVWLPDHFLGFFHPELWADVPASQSMLDPDAFLDPFCSAAVLGRQTSAPIGLAVTDSARRRGADLARAALTLNEISNARFILGLGVGEGESLFPFGYDWTKPTSKLEAALLEIRSLLDTGEMPGDSVGRTGLSRAGDHGIPEVWVAAHGPRGLRLAGTYGDGWLPSTRPVAQYAEMLKQVREAANRASRPAPTAAMGVVTLFGDSRETALAMLDEVPLAKLPVLMLDGAVWELHGVTHPNGPDSKGWNVIPHELDPDVLRRLAPNIPVSLVEELMMVGSAPEIAARLRDYEEAGVQHVVLADFTAMVCAPADAPRAFAHTAELVAILQGSGEL